MCKFRRFLRKTSVPPDFFGYRSKALHEGRPFPAPMSEPPYKRTDWTGAIEKAHGHFSMGGGVWLEKELPVLLCTFEYIARETPAELVERTSTTRIALPPMAD